MVSREVANDAVRRRLDDLRERASEHAVDVLYWVLGAGLPFVLVALVAIGYSAIHYWVCDDAHISFRYAQHLASGNGLVYNVGERVEGYTNFLWVIELAALFKLFGAPFAATSTVLSGIFTVGTFALVYLFAQTTPARAFRYFVTLLALAFLAINRDFAIWSTSGLETRQFTFLCLLAAYLAYASAGRSRWLMYASISLALAELTRPEGLLIGSCVIAWYACDSRLHGRLNPRSLLTLVLPFLAVTLVHYLWRRVYYGEWLPNTYYAKDVRAWPDAGVRYFTAVLCQSGLYLTVPLTALAFVYRFMHKKDTLYFLCVALIVPHAFYVIRIGGDHFEFRPLDHYWPLLALGTAEGLALLVLFIRLALRAWRWPRPRLVAYASGLAVASGVAFYATVLQLANYLLTYDIEFGGGHLAVPISESTFPLAYLAPGFGRVTQAYATEMEFLNRHSIALRYQEHKGFALNQMRFFGPYAAPRRALPSSAVWLYSLAGIAPLSLFEVTVIDGNGLTDKVIARTGGAPNAQRSMAHDRHAPPGYIESRGVNIDILFSATTLSEALSRGEYAVELAPNLWMPFTSPKPDWVLTAFRDYKLFERPRMPTGADDVAIDALVGGAKLRGQRLLGGFERLDEGWTVEGGAQIQVEGQPLMPGQSGRGRLTTFGPRGDADMGRARSPEIVVQPGDALSFLIAGGNLPGVYVQLMVDGIGVEQFRGQNADVFVQALADLNPYVGRKVWLQVTDESAEGWGHILLDHVVLLRPEPPRPGATP